MMALQCKCKVIVLKINDFKITSKPKGKKEKMFLPFVDPCKMKSSAG